MVSAQVRVRVNLVSWEGRSYEVLNDSDGSAQLSGCKAHGPRTTILVLLLLILLLLLFLILIF